MQNWEHLDFWEHKVEGREKKGKNEKPHMVYQQQVHLWEAVRITLPTPSLCNVKGYSLRNSEYSHYSKNKTTSASSQARISL